MRPPFSRSKTASKNPSISGKDSSSSLAGSEASTSGSDESDIEGDFHSMRENNQSDQRPETNYISLKVRTVTKPSLEFLFLIW